jgi:uncharacterized protein YbjQ (UPF0145 family)
VFLGTVVGVISVYICILLKLQIFGFNIFFIISPLIAGFVETYVSRELTGKTTGAISAIILFVVTNIMGWIFPAQPIVWNILTVGGLLMMLQAAFPLAINYMIFAILLLNIYIYGLIGEYFASLVQKITGKKTVDYKNLHDYHEFKIPILTNSPDIPIKQYKGIVSAEVVVRFDDKNHQEKLQYLGSDLNKLKSIKELDYQIAEQYVLEKIEQEAIIRESNAIVDLELEYININDRLPPDVLIAATATAVVLSENNRKNKVIKI